jgi:hypothetical protein
MTRACGRPRHRRTAVGGGALAVELCPRRAVWLAVAFALDGAASLAGAVAVARGGRSLQDGDGGAGAAGTDDTQTVTNAGNDGNGGGGGGATNAKGCTESSGRDECFWDDPYYMVSMVVAVLFAAVLIVTYCYCKAKDIGNVNERANHVDKATTDVQGRVLTPATTLAAPASASVLSTDKSFQEVFPVRELPLSPPHSIGAMQRGQVPLCAAIVSSPPSLPGSSASLHVPPTSPSLSVRLSPYFSEDVPWLQASLVG